MLNQTPSQTPTPTRWNSSKLRWAFPICIALHALLCWASLTFFSFPPVLVVQMASSVFSRAQVYYDAGSGLSEGQSSSAPVRPSVAPQEFRLPLPHARITYLRFDPLTCPGTITISRVEVVRSDGTIALSVLPSQLQGVLGFAQVDFMPNSVRYRVRPDSYDPELVIELAAPLELQSRYPSALFCLRLVLVNLALLAAEMLLLLWAPARKRCKSLVKRINAFVAGIATKLSSEHFLRLDRAAIWFYLVCLTLFVLFSAADFNGSSMGVFWRNYKVGAPARTLAGSPQQIRADEFNYQTPDMLNQSFRERKLEVTAASPGNHSAALLASLPVKHVTTLARPQYWPFFILPADYAFSMWWQAKWLLFATGTFTFLLLLTQSSMLALTGTAWLFFSQFTQWCYTWPSMLPEMGGLLCFTVVFVCYLTVGTRPLLLQLCAIAGAACAINFALMAYVPHLIPYAWTGAIFFVAWCIAHRRAITNPEGRAARSAAGLVCLFLTAAFLFIVLHDAKEAIQGIGATAYPGHRSLHGGEFSWATFGTHFLAGFESEARFPPGNSNICESAGFLWLAPVTLLCFAKMRALSTDRRVLLAGLWASALLLTAWMVLPIPASVGRFLFLDRVMAVRALPALGLLNVSIVALVLSSPDRLKRFNLDAKIMMTLPAALLVMVLVNHRINGYFSNYEVVVSAIWAGVLAAFLWEGKRTLFAAAVLIPNIFLFGLINPVQRGIDTVTSSTLFEIVHSDKRLLNGKWLIFPDIFPASIFIAVGCDVYNGSKYLPDIDHFPLFAAHGLDVRILNNLGYVDVEQLAPGEPATVKRGAYGVVISISPLDPLVKELGIRYVAFHKRPTEAVLAHLKPIRNGIVSEFWLYELEQ